MAVPLLLPTPIPPKSFALGQLLSDPLNASSLSYIDSTRHVTTKPHVEARFKDVLSHDDEGRLINSLSDQPLPLSHDQLLLVQADQMEITYLQAPVTTFNALRQDESAQSFFHTMANQQQPLYYVVGLQTLRNPTFKNAVVQEGSIAEAKTDSKIRLPMHVRRDSTMDIDDASNDAIFGLQLVKVKCKVGRADEPHSLDDIDYQWTYHRLDADELQLAIGLGNLLEASELRKLAGIVYEEDSADESYDSDEFDDEGLAGF